MSVNTRKRRQTGANQAAQGTSASKLRPTPAKPPDMARKPK
jgi:hypothetical protein